MASIQHSHQPTVKYVALVLICLLFHILFTDCGPIRKKKGRSKNASPTMSHGISDSTLTQSSNAIANINADYLQEVTAKNKNITQFDQVNFAGKRVAPGRINDELNEDVAAGNSLVPNGPAPHKSIGDGDIGEKVGKLPPVLAIPDLPEGNTTLEGQKLKSVKNGDADPHTREEQGVAVGVGGMNRGASTTTTAKAPGAFHEGPEDSLDVGAADRGGPPENRPKAQSLNQASDNNNPSDTDKTREIYDLPMNPALQQPPPQAREPPDQFQNKKIQLGPVNHEAPVLEPAGQQQAPMGRDEINLKGPEEEPAPAVEATDEEQPPAEQPLKFKPHQKSATANDKQSDKLNDINPPDHMEGFRMERDGHINRDYKKEIFLGHHEEFEWSDEEKVSGKLKVIFRRVDTNGDNYMDAKEIEMWIMKNVKVHLDDAIKDNAKVFKHLDADKDGFVSWFEFFSHFLVAKGYVHSAKNVPKNESAVKLEIDDSERILKYRYRWSDADEEPKDEKLDLSEMMNFRHPEQSKLLIDRLISDLIDTVDKDADGIITEAEFIALPHDLAGENPLPQDEEWQEERKKEFRNVIDLNKDGKADNKELKIYFNPHNTNHAKLEASNLIRMADSNNDEKLSMKEVLDNTELFLFSKMVDARLKLHDEF